MTELWGSKPNRFLGSSDRLGVFSQLCCTAELALPKINYAATFLKETLTTCLEKIVALSANLSVCAFSL